MRENSRQQAWELASIRKQLRLMRSVFQIQPSAHDVQYSREQSGWRKYGALIAMDYRLPDS